MTDKTERGIAAKHLIDNALLREVLNTLDATYHAQWRVAETVEAREDCHRYVRLIENLTADIREIAMTGKLEQQRLDELAALQKKPRLDIWADENRQVA